MLVRVALLLLLLLLSGSSLGQQVIKVKVGETQAVSIGVKRQHVCVTEGQRSKSLWGAIAPNLAFLETTVEIIATGDSDRISFPYFAVRGKSTDDFHENVGLLIHLTLFKERPDIAESVDRSSLLRDLLSSCPSPIDFKFQPANAATLCRMKFSSMGTPCVSLPALSSSKSPSKVSVVVKQVYNYSYAYNLGLCLLFLYAAMELSEYKTFQYITGMMFFVAAGLLLVVIYMDKIFGVKNTKARTMLFLLTSSTVYATSFLLFLQSMLRRLLVDYWEIVAVYVTAMSLLGLVFTRWMRSKEETKHFFKVSAKWFMRSVAIVAGYNAFPSPLSSLLFILALAALYAAHYCKKFLGKSSKSHKK